MQLLILGQQVVLGLLPIGIRDDAFGRAHELALRLVLRADALRAFHRVDDIDRISRGNRLIGTDGFARVTRGARLGDHQCHGRVLLLLLHAALGTSRSAATRPLSRARPPVIITTPLTAPIDFSSLDSRAAIERWMPFRMFDAVMPRDTMLMTSVSANTAQMLDTTSGLSAWRDNVPISSWAMPR